MVQTPPGTMAERYERGTRLRKKVWREKHADLRTHARSANPALLAGYTGKSGVFDDALASFAMAYATRTQHDYEQLVKAKHSTERKAA